MFFCALTNFQAATKQQPVDATAKKVTEGTESAAAKSTTASSSRSSTVEEIELAATAGEARKRVGKKKDVKTTSLSIKDRYDIFQNM